MLEPINLEPQQVTFYLTAAQWAIIGVVLIGVEVLTTHFVLIFFGFAALIIAGMKAIFGLDTLTTELLIFSVLGIGSMFLLRRKLSTLLKKSTGRFKADLENTIELTEALGPQAHGKIQYQGAPWTVFNESDQALSAGEKVQIRRIDGVKLVVQRPSIKSHSTDAT